VRPAQLIVTTEIMSKRVERIERVRRSREMGIKSQKRFSCKISEHLAKRR
jgi:hypothetical protein